MRRSILSYLWIMQLVTIIVTGLQYERCEFIEVLKNHGIEGEELRVLACTGFIATEFGKSPSDSPTNYGILGIEQKLCGATKGACNVPCNFLTDDNVTDDIECIRFIYKTLYESRAMEYSSICSIRKYSDIVMKDC